MTILNRNVNKGPNPIFRLSDTLITFQNVNFIFFRMNEAKYKFYITILNEQKRKKKRGGGGINSRNLSKYR